MVYNMVYPPSQFLRLLAHAHATTHRLHWMGVFATPHCKYCFHEKADIYHLVWDLREAWPTGPVFETSWPAYALTAKLFTKDMSPNHENAWCACQILVAELLFNGWKPIFINTSYLTIMLSKHCPKSRLSLFLMRSTSKNHSLHMRDHCHFHASRPNHKQISIGGE